MKIASHELTAFALAIFATCAVTVPAQQTHHVNAGRRPAVGGDFTVDDVEREHILSVLERVPKIEDAAALSNAPKRAGAFYVVPKVVE